MNVLFSSSKVPFIFVWLQPHINCSTRAVLKSKIGIEINPFALKIFLTDMKKSDSTPNKKTHVIA